MKPGIYDITFKATLSEEKRWDDWRKAHAESIEVLGMQAVTTGTGEPEMVYRVRVTGEVKWRSVFAGWQLGTRQKGEPESDAVRDHREVTILLRAEQSALVALLVDKGVFTTEEYQRALTKEAKLLDADFECRFPGFKSVDHGISMELPEVVNTMRRMNFKP